MTKLAAKLTSQFVALLLIAAVALLVVAGAGAWGLYETHGAADKLYNDQLRTVDETATVGQELDDSYETAQSILLAPTPARRRLLADDLFQDLIPSAEVALTDLRLIHEGDPPNQVALVQQLEDGWARFRKLWTTQSLLAPVPDQAAVSAQLDAVFGPLEGVADRLLAIEQDDATDDHERADNASITSMVLIGAALGTELLLGGLLAWFVARRVLPRALAPEEAQAKFAGAMQLAGDEDEGCRLLQLYLERSVKGSRVVVLGRDKVPSALQAMTSPAAALQAVTDGLRVADGATCLAAKAARAHREPGDLDQLVSCQLCGGCPGVSVCTPLSIRGESVGSVLVNRATLLDADEERCIRDSILRAAPVLHNLRSLAAAEAQAATDSLTGLPNKRSVEATFRQMVAQANRSSTMLAVLAADLDHFKTVNDTYGHGRGDAVLAAVGAALRSVLRVSDFAGRSGGEEFLLLLPSTDGAGARGVAEKVRAAIADLHVPGVDRPLGLSIGVAVYPLHSGDADGVLRCADRALYRAKSEGRNRVELATMPDPRIVAPVAEPPARRADEPLSFDA